MRIRTAVIPAAGLGTRFLPITKAIPKEMLPIVDTPIIQYVVDEVVSAGIRDIVIVVNSRKPAIRNYFQRDVKLERELARQGKRKEAAQVARISRQARFRFVNQVGPYGNATPVISARAAVGRAPFVVIWGDEFVWATPPRLVQMMRVFGRYQCSVISGVRIPRRADVHRYGIGRITPVARDVFQIHEIVEKPHPAEAPSTLAVHGAYILTPAIFDHLALLTPGRGGELWLIDGINALARHERVLAAEIRHATYYDTGNKLEYLKANLDFVRRHPDLGRAIRSHLLAAHR